MKAITLHEPWATLIACGAKKIETRDWAPPRSVVGERIAIHAARREPGAGNLQLLKTLDEVPSGYRLNAYRVDCRCSRSAWLCRGDGDSSGLRQGRPYLRTVSIRRRLWSTWKTRKLGHDRWVVEDAYGDFSLGRYLWYLEDVKVISPAVPAKGHQGFWNFTFMPEDASVPTADTREV